MQTAKYYSRKFTVVPWNLEKKAFGHTVSKGVCCLSVLGTQAHNKNPQNNVASSIRASDNPHTSLYTAAMFSGSRNGREKEGGRNLPVEGVSWETFQSKSDYQPVLLCNKEKK